MFADNTAYQTNEKSISEIEPKLQHNDHGNISKYCTMQIKMLIHYDKTTCVTVGTRHKTLDLPELNVVIDNNKIKVSKTAEIRNRYNQVPHLT